MGLRRAFISRLLLILFLIPIFYFAFWIFWDIGLKLPFQLVLIGNLFNILMLLVFIIIEVFLWMAIEYPEFRSWLLTLERNPRSNSAKKQKQKKKEFRKKGKEAFF